ncbi:DNA-binding transcriptional activator GcvA [Rhodanobacter panaciterrae]|uniref:DNA-binding transcriptional activator GcvA n=1 Tax=Rhodanobacter panaciterrae TaxID=490572 RepID=A0ABQ3A4T5_9GAMM|nr:LysR substrate-binding domain-containing protein [Rhodanobacter panaciterrae]GGY32748.1 DNA-binding transcriptional activator GcvA [Rhodanobacter panaciterrae]
MKYLLPPMHTLRTFEALGRLRHFTRTAEELHLTTSAVSHQIRVLESFHAARLFVRNRHDVALTPAGERLMVAVRHALQQLSTASESIRAQDAARLSVTAPPSLVSRWLMPRLGVFLQQHPTVDFRLRATSAVVDLAAEEIDLGIRFGGGRWPGMRSEKLFDEEIFPVASPAYLAHMKVRRWADLRRCLLLRDDFHSWEDWLDEIGATTAGCTFGSVFNDSALSLQAAEAGQGVVLARSLLAADAIKAGTLARVGKRAVRSRGSYYLVAPSDRQDGAAVGLFREWLRETASH